MNNSNPTLRKAYKLLKRLAKKLGNPDLHFVVQMGVDSSRPGDTMVWAANIEAPRDGMAPITWAEFDKDKFLANIKDTLDNKTSPEQVEVAYHEFQVGLNDRSSEWHKEQIERINNPEPEFDESTATEEEIQEHVREHGEK
jgi:hypothetical protein